MGPERRVGPFLLLDRDDVGVGVEENRGEVRIRALPLEKDDRLALDEFQGPGLKRERFGLGKDEISRLTVVWMRMGCTDLKVLLESRYDR